MSIVDNTSDLQHHRFAVTSIQPIFEFLRTSIITKRFRTEKGGKERVKQLITINGTTPIDLLDTSRPEPRLVPWSGNAKVDMQGLEEIENVEADEDISMEEYAGSMEDEMLLQPPPSPPPHAGPSRQSGSSSKARMPPPKYNISNIQHKLSEPSQVLPSQAQLSQAQPSQAGSDITHVSQTTIGEKRLQSSPG